MRKFSPSSAAFAIGSQTFSEWPSGCPRNMYLAANGLKTPFPESNTLAGHTYEALKDAAYRAANKAFWSEFPFKAQFADNFLISGRLDYILEGEIIELKSCNSPTSRTKHLSKGIPTLGNIAQLVTYMTSFRNSRGTLIYGEVIADKKTKVLEIGREVVHVVTLQQDGAIHVNDHKTPYSVSSLVNHRRIYNDAFEADVLPDRPFNESRFNGPCARCAWNTICTIADTQQLKSAADFLTLAKEPSHDTDDNI